MMRLGMRLPAQPDWPVLADEFGASALLQTVPFLVAIEACKGRMAYLATPYSKIAVGFEGRWCPIHSDAAANEAARWAARFAINGLTVVSPIVQAVEIINVDYGRAIDPLDQKFWTRWCKPMLSASIAVIIPPIDGWDVSQGVWDEACWALNRHRAVFLIRPGSEGEVRQ